MLKLSERFHLLILLQFGDVSSDGIEKSLLILGLHLLTLDPKILITASENLIVHS